MIGKYKAGKYRELTDLIHHFRCKKITIRCDSDNEINLDGELLMGKNIEFEVVPRAIRFFYPRGLTYHAAK